jgi:hypothetical protein
MMVSAGSLKPADASWGSCLRGWGCPEYVWGEPVASDWILGNDWRSAWHGFASGLWVHIHVVELVVCQLFGCSNCGAIVLFCKKVTIRRRPTDNWQNINGYCGLRERSICAAPCSGMTFLNVIAEWREREAPVARKDLCPAGCSSHKSRLSYPTVIALQRAFQSLRMKQSISWPLLSS